MSDSSPQATTNVCVIYTGGTIGMVPDRSIPGAPLRPASEQDLLEAVPSLRPALSGEGIEFQIVRLKDRDGNEIEALDSSDVMQDHWSAIARAIEDNYDAFDGFLVLHGTDTMAYTCSALSFLLHHLAKPVVVTGSQLPIAEARTDGLMNLINGMYIAGYKAMGLPLIPEVVLVFADGVFRGNRLTKVSTTRFQGFDTPNDDRIGDLGEHIRIHEERIRPIDEGPFFVDSSLSDNEVVVLTLYPGLRADLLERVANIAGVKGLVLRTFGAGNAPTEVGSPGLIDAIRGAVDSGIHVVNVTQCSQGMVEAGLYEASSGLLDAGVLSGMDMTEEAALTKLMWLLATEPNPKQIPLQMQINLRGELSDSLLDFKLEQVGTDAPTTVSVDSIGQFKKDRLTKATLRVSGLKPDGIAQGSEFGVRVFLNRSRASWDDVRIPHYAGEVRSVYADPKAGVKLSVDMTEAMRRSYEDGRGVSVTLVLESGGGLTFTEAGGCSVSLFMTD